MKTTPGVRNFFGDPQAPGQKRIRPETLRPEAVPTGISPPNRPVPVNRALLLCLLCAGLCAGCLSAKEAVDGEGATVEVQNRRFLDVTVYVFRGGHRLRLGVVTGTRSAVFTLPGSFVREGGPFRFVADPIGSDRLALDAVISLFPGDAVLVVVPSRRLGS